MIDFLRTLISSRTLKVLCVVIVLDVIFGVLRSFKEKSTNSCIGIDGMIRKTGMLITVITLTFIDLIINVDFIGFIPQEVRQALKFNEVGIADIFNILFIVFESLSILKNMILCKMPIPKKLQIFLEKIMKEFTGEVKENE